MKSPTIVAILTGIRHLGNLVTIESIPIASQSISYMSADNGFLPTLAGSSIHEIDDVIRIFEVDEGIADIAVVGEVDTKVHEVILPVA